MPRAPILDITFQKSKNSKETISLHATDNYFKVSKTNNKIEYLIAFWKFVLNPWQGEENVSEIPYSKDSCI